MRNCVIAFPFFQSRSSFVAYCSAQTLLGTPLLRQPPPACAPPQCAPLLAAWAGAGWGPLAAREPQPSALALSGTWVFYGSASFHRSGISHSFSPWSVFLGASHLSQAQLGGRERWLSRGLWFRVRWWWRLPSEVSRGQTGTSPLLSLGSHAAPHRLDPCPRCDRYPRTPALLSAVKSGENKT